MQIDTARGKALADEYGALFFETSAKDGTGVKDAFHSLARQAVSKLAVAGGTGDATASSSSSSSGTSASGVKQLKGGKGADGGGGKEGKDCAIM